MGTLHSGFCRDGENLIDDVNFSMFGTSRKVNCFQICIRQASENEEESCRLDAIPSYELELDFRDELEEDFVGFDVVLHEQKFKKLLLLLERRLVDSVWLRVSGVSGIYADWSPSITTYSAKILTPSHDIKGLIDGKPEPKRVGEIDEFDLNFVTHSKLDPKKAFAKGVDFEGIFDNSQSEPILDLDETVKASGFAKPEYHEKLVDTTAVSAQLVRSLKLPLWCIFSALVLLLMSS